MSFKCPSVPHLSRAPSYDRSKAKQNDNQIVVHLNDPLKAPTAGIATCRNKEKVAHHHDIATRLPARSPFTILIARLFTIRPLLTSHWASADVNSVACMHHYAK